MKTETSDVTANFSKKPTHVAYQVRDGGEGNRGFWTRIGSVWTNSDGKGFNIQLDCLPIDGRITVRIIEERPEGNKPSDLK